MKRYDPLRYLSAVFSLPDRPRPSTETIWPCFLRSASTSDARTSLSLLISILRLSAEKNAAIAASPTIRGRFKRFVSAPQAPAQVANKTHLPVHQESAADIRSPGQSVCESSSSRKLCCRCWRPMERRNLLACKPNERISVPKRVIQKRKRMILGQRRQPERQLRQIGGHRVLVQPIQAALCDHSLCVERFVLVERNARNFIMRVPRLG